MIRLIEIKTTKPKTDDDQLQCGRCMAVSGRWAWKPSTRIHPAMRVMVCPSCGAQCKDTDP